MPRGGHLQNAHPPIYSNASNKWVKVVIHPYEYPKVEAHFSGEVYLLQPIEKDQYGRLSQGTTYGEYKSHKHTVTQKAKSEMEKIAADEWGISWKGTGDKRRAIAPPVGHETPLKVFGHQADKVKVDFISRKGTELNIEQPQALTAPVTADAHEVSRSIIDRRIPIMEFFSMLKGEIGKITPELNSALRAEFGESISKSKAEEVIAEIKSGTWKAASGAGDSKQAAAM